MTEKEFRIQRALGTLVVVTARPNSNVATINGYLYKLPNPFWMNRNYTWASRESVLDYILEHYNETFVGEATFFS